MTDRRIHPGLLIMLIGGMLSGCGTVYTGLPEPASSVEDSQAADSVSLADRPQPASDSSDTQEPIAPAAAACAELGEPMSDVHQDLLDALNEYRASLGLSPLIYSRTLEAAAQAQAEDLWQRDFFSHTNPDGELPGDRALRAGFCHKYVGENLAAGQATVERAMQAWKNSPSHDLNMREPDYVYVGFGFSIDPDGRRYWSQSFAYDLP